MSAVIAAYAGKSYVSPGSGSLSSTSYHCTCFQYIYVCAGVIFDTDPVTKICNLSVSEALYPLATGMVRYCNEFRYNHCMDIVWSRLRHASYRFCYGGVLVVSVIHNQLILGLTIISSWTMLYGQLLLPV